MIDILNIIGERSALQRHSAPICCHPRITVDALCGHREVEFHAISALPSALNRHVAVLEGRSVGPAVDPKDKSGPTLGSTEYRSDSVRSGIRNRIVNVVGF